MPSKYHNRKTVKDGITFASKAEATRYQELLLRERAGEIADLTLQVPFILKVNGMKVCTYIADFVYTERGKQVVEDKKGARTRVYALKRKLMKAVYGIDILET